MLSSVSPTVGSWTKFTPPLPQPDSGSTQMLGRLS